MAERRCGCPEVGHYLNCPLVQPEGVARNAIRNEARDRRRAEARVAARLARPRCLICDKPIQYGKPGVRLSAVTCGSDQCRRRRYWWFGRR